MQATNSCKSKVALQGKNFSLQGMEPALQGKVWSCKYKLTLQGANYPRKLHIRPRKE